MDFKYFITIYKKCTAEPYSFLVNDTTLSSDDPLKVVSATFLFVYFLCLKESTREARTSSWMSYVIKCLSMKHETHIIE